MRGQAEVRAARRRIGVPASSASPRDQGSSGAGFARPSLERAACRLQVGAYSGRARPASAEREDGDDAHDDEDCDLRRRAGADAGSA